MRGRLNILLAISVAAVSLWCTGGLMRKNDQAAIMAGAYDLAHHRMQSPEAYYQVDKTFVLYATCAAVLCVVRHISPIVACNVAVALVFWIALLAFVYCFRQRLPSLYLLCFLTAPAVLLNTLYVNSSVLSSGFLLLSACLFFRQDRRADWLAAVLFFLAVGSRADILLLLPFVLWLTTPFPRVGKILDGCSNGWKSGLRELIAFSKPWKLIAGGGLALLCGRLICQSGGKFIDPIFNGKMVAGYFAFGFGAAGLLFVCDAFRFAGSAFRTRGIFEKLYWLAGLFAFLLPVLFFLPQLHAPRYFWRGSEALLLLAVSGRLPEVNCKMLKVIFCAAALLPLAVGAHFQTLTTPRLSISSPTLFPSGDGSYPMGSYLRFLVRMRNGADEPIDHNQLVWNAARQAHFILDSDRKIPVLRTPMSGYLLLSASLQGRKAVRLSYKRLAGGGFYADSRSFMRDDPKSYQGYMDRLLSDKSLFVSPVDCGIGILRFGVGDFQWGRRTRLLNSLFFGNEYRLYHAADVPENEHLSVWFVPASFPEAQYDAASGLYWSRTRPENYAEADVICAQAVLPSWMTIQSFMGPEE